MDLTGIARLAAASDLLEQKRRVEYFEIETRNFVGRCSGKNMPFIWTANPYRGCEFGCKYCYARYTHEFMELRDPEQFERKIYVKRFDAIAFRGELKRVKAGESLWIGTATDPYQPAERRYRITRRMLEVLAGETGRKLGITTKSDLVRRDIDLLAVISRRNILHLNITVTTMDEALVRLLEPLAPRPALRMQAVAALARAGLRITVLASPVLPLLNDSEASLDAVAGAAKAAGAASFAARPVFLKPCAQQVFFPFLEQNFPGLVRRYRERFEAGAYLKGAYPGLIAERVAKMVERHAFGRRDEDYDPPDWPAERQLTLF